MKTERGIGFPGTFTRRTFLKGTGGALAATALAGSAAEIFTAGTALAANQGGQFVLELGEPDTLFAPTAQSALAASMFSFIANGLTKLRQPDMTVVGDLASSWTASGDGLTYVFTLHPNVKWQDGQTFSADDVKFTYEYQASPDWPGPLPPELANISGAQQFKSKQASEVTGIKVLSPAQVQFTLLQRSATFLATIAAQQQLPKHILSAINAGDAPTSPFARKPVYTGPFAVQDWKTGEGVTFQAFGDSFVGRPALDGIVGSNVPDPSDQIAQLKTGELNASFVSSDSFSSFASNASTYHTQQMRGTLGWFIAFDLTNPLFSDVRVRKALNHAVDRETIVKTIFSGRAQASYTLTSPLSWVYDAGAPKFTYNVSTAKQLLDAAGWKPGAGGVRAKNGKKLEFTVNVTADTQTWAVALQPYFQKVGAMTHIDTMEFGTWIAKQQVGMYQAAFSGWQNFLIDPRLDMSTNWESPRTPDATGYKNPQVDQLFQQARSAPNRAAEKKLYNQIQQIVGNDVPYVYLFRVNDLLVVNRKFSVPVCKIQPEFYARAPQWQQASG